MNGLMLIMFLVLMVVVVPAIIGLLWVTCVGGLVYGSMKLYELFIKFTLNKVIVFLYKIPFFGRVVTFFISILVVITMTSLIFSFFTAPIWFIMLKSFEF